MSKDQPVYTASVVTEKKGREYWTKVGVVFAHKNGEGFNLVIPEGISISGTIVLTKPKPKDDVSDTSDDNHLDEGQ